MKKKTNITIKMISIFLALVIMTSSVYAVATNINIMSDFGGTAAENVREASGTAWATVATIVQILAVGAIVFAGLNYMFSSADKKADIKKGATKLAVGAGLVFASTTVVKFIADMGEEVL